MVLFLTRGFAQIPILKINARGTKRNIIAPLRPISSLKPSTIKGITAPPTIPVHKIPANEP